MLLCCYYETITVSWVYLYLIYREHRFIVYIVNYKSMIASEQHRVIYPVCSILISVISCEMIIGSYVIYYRCK